MPTVTPTPLTTVWSVSHGLDPFFQGEQILADAGLLLVAGTQDLLMGVTSVVFDDATGEPLGFDTIYAASLGDLPTLLGVWHFPAESCVVVAGYHTSGTTADNKLWARRVYYDASGNLTTPDPLVTWTPSLTAASGVPCAVGVESSSSLQAIWFSSSSCKTAVLDLAAGSVGATATHSLATIFGGSIDRVDVTAQLRGHHPEAAMLAGAFVAAAGASTATTYLVVSSGGTPTSTQKTVVRTTHGTGPPDDDRTFMDIAAVSGSLGGSGPRRVVDPGGLFLDVQPPDANFIFAKTLRTTRARSGYLDSHNREDLTYGTVSGSDDKRRVREFDLTTGSEFYAWEYPGPIGSHPYTGRLVERGEFWFTVSGATFSVHGGAYPVSGPRFWLGKVGFRG